MASGEGELLVFSQSDSELSVRCVFVDAGVSAVDLERKKRKEEEKARRAQASVSNNELALLTVEGPKAVSIMDRMALRPPMLQVVRLASFQTAPSVPPFVSMPKISKTDGEAPSPLKDLESRVVNEPVVAGGGVSVAVSRLPPEQKRPVGPLVVVGVKDGVLWLVDRYCFYTWASHGSESHVKNCHLVSLRNIKSIA